MQLHNISMTDLLHYFDFWLYIFSVEIVGKDAFVDHFDCNRLPCFDDFAPIDWGIGTLA